MCLDGLDCATLLYQLKILGRILTANLSLMSDSNHYKGNSARKYNSSNTILFILVVDP